MNCPYAMTVSGLIKALSEYPADMVVCIYDADTGSDLHIMGIEMDAKHNIVTIDGRYDHRLKFCTNEEHYLLDSLRPRS